MWARGRLNKCSSFVTCKISCSICDISNCCGATNARVSKRHIYYLMWSTAAYWNKWIASVTWNTGEQQDNKISQFHLKLHKCFVDYATLPDSSLAQRFSNNEPALNFSICLNTTYAYHTRMQVSEQRRAPQAWLQLLLSHMFGGSTEICSKSFTVLNKRFCNILIISGLR